MMAASAGDRRLPRRSGRETDTLNTTLRRCAPASKTHIQAPSRVKAVAPNHRNVSPLNMVLRQLWHPKSSGRRHYSCGESPISWPDADMCGRAQILGMPRLARRSPSRLPARWPGCRNGWCRRYMQITMQGGSPEHDNNASHISRATPTEPPLRTASNLRITQDPMGHIAGAPVWGGQTKCACS